MKSLTIEKKDHILKGNLNLPASKSISNRILIIRALCNHDIPVENLSDAEDTLLLEKLLALINAGHTTGKVRELDTANAGTVMRFLTAFLAFRPGTWMLTGNDRMKQRPIGILAEALKSIGADINYLGKIGFPPIIIHGAIPHGNQVEMDPGVSSQYISALMMIASGLPEGLTIVLQGNPVSVPYIEMTAGMMRYFGIKVKIAKGSIRVFPGLYKPRPFLVESDWSSSAFWYEAASLSGEVNVTLNGLFKDSFQGDAILSRIFQNFGIQTEFIDSGIKLSRIKTKIDRYYFDFNNFPDIAPSVITTCAMLGLHGRFEGLKSLKIKESDRLRAMQNELIKMGCIVVVSNGEAPTLELKACRFKDGNELTFESYGDHRMAMTFAMLATIAGSVRIINPDVVSKSYPSFWEHLLETGFEIK